MKDGWESTSFRSTRLVGPSQGVVTIALSGDLDMATVRILRGTLAPFEANGVSTIILDLQDLTFIDSTGLHAFLEARNRAMSNGQRLLVRGRVLRRSASSRSSTCSSFWTIRSPTWSLSRANRLTPQRERRRA
jgi:anti-anti-sigma factor